MSLEKAEKQLQEAQERLKKEQDKVALKIGQNMVKQQNFKSYASYREFLNNAKKALKNQTEEKQEQLPIQLQQASLNFEKRLDLWTENNWDHKIDYKDFYPELLEFFKQLNKWQNQ